MLVSQSAREARTVSRVIRLLAGIAIVAVVVVHGHALWKRIEDPVAVWVSAAMLAIALTLLISSIRPMLLPARERA